MATQFNNSESSSLNSDYPKTMAMPNQYGFGCIDSYMVISAATSNEAFIKKGRGTFYGVSLTNTGSSDAFIRIFDKSSAPVSLTDTAVMTFALKADSVYNLVLPIGVGLVNGLGINITAAATILNDGAIGAEQVVGSVFWN
jgi:hypothetical protein|tara:strand:- start:1388 stop:1810 length:423 start_codon:yes stop_codon:yes gene_type:complete